MSTETGMVEGDVCLFPQTRGLILTYSKKNYSETMRCTNLGGQLLCARPAQYDPLMIVAAQSPGSGRMKEGARSSTDDDEAGNNSDFNQQIYMGDGVCLCSATHTYTHTKCCTHKHAFTRECVHVHTFLAHTHTHTHAHTRAHTQILKSFKTAAERCCCAALSAPVGRTTRAKQIASGLFAVIARLVQS